jgi:2-oxoisovalerate dehydrogenase E2 component (dihydrolipoyl transacylase)
MATTITMPQLGETVTEGTVAQWLKKPGDAVEKYEAFVEVSTDKVNAEVPSPVSGVLREIICKEGETVATGAPIAVIDETSDATVAAPATTAPVQSAATTPATESGQTPSTGTRANVYPADDIRGGGAPATGAPTNGAPTNGVFPNGTRANGAPTNGNGNGNGRAAEILRRMSPAVRRLAREHHVDPAALHGTGANGRVTANDVIAAAQQGPSAVMAATILHEPLPVAQPTPADRPTTVATPASPAPAVSGTSTYGSPVPGTLVPLTPARKLIAKRMVESLATAPHAWTMVEVDVTKLWRWRAQEKDRFLAERGYALTLLPFFIFAAVQALKKQPLLNARYTDDGILVHREINVSIAIGLDTNLIVPVIREADSLSIGGLAIAAGRLIEKARAGRLGADDMSGGTFTVNNTGANGSILSKPILNGGQAGIVTMEAVVKRPVVVNDAIAIRQMMNVCLSLDHRVIDGTIANAFLGDLKRRLEAMAPGGDL